MREEGKVWLFSNYKSYRLQSCSGTALAKDFRETWLWGKASRPLAYRPFTSRFTRSRAGSLAGMRATNKAGVPVWAKGKGSGDPTRETGSAPQAGPPGSLRVWTLPRCVLRTTPWSPLHASIGWSLRYYALQKWARKRLRLSNSSKIK